MLEGSSMERLCIYCGQREATERDHVPPKSFFASPRPDNLITVPSCPECNRSFGKDDERVRNLITSLDLTDSHPAIQSELGDKVARSFSRQQGRSNFEHLAGSLQEVEVTSQSGVYLGRRPALNLDQDVMDRFTERLVRALLYHENGVHHAEGEAEWKFAPTRSDLESMPEEITDRLASAPRKHLGDVFSYLGIYQPNRAASLWVVQFYGALELMVIFRSS